MRLGITDYIDCAHTLPGHPKCGQLHGHTYRVEVEVEGPAEGGMVLDFADLKAQVRSVLGRYDHRHWNDFLEYPTVENICRRIAETIRGVDVSLDLSIFSPKRLLENKPVYEGHGKWAATGVTP